MDKILIIGANGQIGSALTYTLRENYSNHQVIAADIRPAINDDDGPFELLDILDKKRLAEVIKKHQINQIYHLAAILSAKGESNPILTWDVNVTGLLNVLEVSQEFPIRKVFFPSSMAVFGNNVDFNQTPQNSQLVPETVYGMTKAAGENWCNYYYQKYQLDIRSIRYPGIISSGALPGGGTTDYAVDIYHKAVQQKDFICFLSENSILPMLYMPDAVEGTLQLMEAPAEKVKLRIGYNMSGMSFSPAEIYQSILKHFPDFKITYQPDFRQTIADSWPNSIDDSQARKDWNWSPSYNLEEMTNDMIVNLQKYYKTRQQS